MAENNKVDIGFLEEKNSWQLHPKFFPSKVGGKPAWLDLQNLPNPSQLTCKKCSDPLIFLCQIYAPYEERYDTFHRTIFIFICRNGSCCRTNSSENFVVLRCQLERKNDFYAFEPYDENIEEEFPMDKYPKLCDVCGAKGPSHCSKCKKSYYCSRKHQVLDWQKGHKGTCQQQETIKLPYFTVTEAGKSVLFKEWDLAVDEEDEAEVSDVDVDKEMDKLRKMMEEKRAGTLSNISEDELEQYSGKVPEDKVFNKFNKRIARHPEQVLRYDRGGTPLWITGNTENVIQIPNCQFCDGERQFEFQIMPQLLNFINVGIDFNSIDWGILAIYTCKASCNAGPAYKEEYLIKQDLSN
ncbi:programmed cell death protein 2 isoform X1 [Ostrinia furnacalis]|uniref:programmed cell death protein 2 isoform X1 n=1 Tax=Ostrinia furnacalis TaxID=93504 RepID=UPI001038793A|nr:programmed cell death protein 2 isoform X1 [Ostrinia furnacalis]XP_028162473.1 programmed cell death protein 2 isoform X1 [Ostrinia furnacalis]